ncbi:MAG: SprB repeat-containing protein [Bacteroidetes bacterium]|nr:SprB repeat-containing protein [Bacteroidota bacterium]
MYNVTVTYCTGCTKLGQVYAEIGNEATVDAGPDISGCMCCATIFTVSGVIGGSATTASWSSNGGGSFSNGGVWTGAGETYTPAGADLTGSFPKTITVTLTTNDPAGTCPAVSDTLLLTMYQTPLLTTTPAVFCSGSNVDLALYVTDANATTGVLSYYTTLANAQNQTSPISSIVSAAGTYYIRKNTTTTPVCSDIDSVVVSASTLALSQTHVDVTCFGESTGSINVTTTPGTSPYTYVWSGGSTVTTEDRTGLAAGTYTVTVTDANGCTATVSATILQPATAVSATCTGVNVLCNGAATGSASVTASGGTGTLTYVWSNSNTNTGTGISGLAAGTYTVTVTDANSCSTSCSYTVTQPTTAVTATCTGVNVLCNGAATGTASVTASGGTGTLTYVWSNSNTNTGTGISGLAAGTYTVTVTDANSCSTSCSYTVTQPAVLTCVGSGTSSTATSAPSGGTSPYTFLWNTSPAQTTSTATGLATGTYTVTVTDANLCTTSCSYTLLNQITLTCVATGTNVSCNGGSNGTATSTPAGGTSPYTYLWNDGAAQTTATATGLIAGTYTVTVTDANLCTATCSYTVTQPATLTLTLLSTNVSCAKGKDGTAGVSASGGTSPYSYLWSNGKTTSTLSGIGAGTYTVTVTDSKGCTKTGSVVITQPSVLAVLFTSTNVSCNGGSNATITLTPTGGTPFASGPTPRYIFDWYNIPFGATINGTNNTQGVNQVLSGPAGMYWVKVKDSKGCITTACITITQPAAPLGLSITGVNVKCNGGSNGMATAQVTGGTSPYTYLWSNSKTTATIKGLSAGTYTVTVTDIKGCTTTGSVVITAPAALTCGIAIIDGVTCLQPGKLQVTPTGGTPGYSYTWNTKPVQTTNIATGLAAGTSTVSVKDANGCVTTCSMTLAAPPSISVSCTSTNITCSGLNNGTATAMVTGGTGAITYLWNSGAATSITSGLMPGTYTVVVTDGNGCTATCSATVTQPAQLSCVATGTNVSCNAGTNGTTTVSAVGGTSPYTYLWNDASSQASQTALALAAGTYTVIVTDANLCTTTCSVTITAPSAITANPLAATNVNCPGGNNGTATISGVAGGTSPFVISWNTVPPQGTTTATGLTAGTYTVTVTDAHGCTYTSSIDVTAPANSLNVTASTTNVLCNGGADGTAEFETTGGTGAITYSLNGGAPITMVTNPTTLSGLAAGAYTLIVTDANGCMVTISFTITEPMAMMLSTNGTNVSCFGGADGTATVNAMGGIPAYTYLWSDALAQTTQTAINLSIGTYIVTVTDANGCFATASVDITEPSPMICNASSTNVSCNAGTNGTVAASATGGTPSYTYAWTNSSSVNVGNTATVSGLPAGVYVVTITDANGCTVVCTANITEPSALAITVTGTTVCNGQSNGSLTANVSGGVAGYSYAWSNGTNWATNTGLLAGTYTVTVTDANGCTITASAIVLNNTAIVVDSLVTNASCGNANCTASTGVVTGGTAPYTYLWSTGAATSSIVAVAGTYYVTVTDAMGCTAIRCMIIGQNSTLQASGAVTNVMCFGLATGAISTITVGGTGPYTYLWTGGSSATTASISGLTAGAYTVTITDSSTPTPCSVTLSFTVNEPALLTVGIGTTQISCQNPLGGAVPLVGGGTAPYSYVWTNGTSTFATTSSVYGLTPGTYTVTVTDANGCTATASTTINALVSISCSATGTNPLCFNTNTGTATVTTTNGSGIVTYLWNSTPAQTTATATGLPAGVYEVKVMDAAGCSSMCSVTLVGPSPINVVASTVDVTCKGGNNGSAMVTTNGGTPWTGLGVHPAGYQYLWSNGTTTAGSTNLSAGNYIVTITDSIGCTLIHLITIGEPSALSSSIVSTNSLCGNATGTASASVYGGTAPYSYLWNNGNANATILGLAPATYTITVTDAHGCSTTSTTYVSAPGSPTFSLAVKQAACFNALDTIKIVNLSGGTGNYDFVWSAGTTITGIDSLTAIVNAS